MVLNGRTGSIKPDNDKQSPQKGNIKHTDKQVEQDKPVQPVFFSAVKQRKYTPKNVLQNAW